MIIFFSTTCFSGIFGKVILKRISLPRFVQVNVHIDVKSDEFFQRTNKFLNDTAFKCQLKKYKFNAVIASHYSSDDKNMTDINDEYFFNAKDGIFNKNITSEELNSLMSILKDILEYRRQNNSLVLENKVKILCRLFKHSSDEQRKEFLLGLAKCHAVDHSQIYEVAKSLSEITDKCSLKVMKTEDRLRNLLTPQYLWLFLCIGKLENGVKFLVDLRTDVLDLISEKNLNDSVEDLQKLNATLRDLLSMWFSVGFLELERVTWKSPCEILQKISEYEAVHPVRNWTDLKRRVGAYRRCFIFLHHSMPAEPIVVLHTALTDEISSSVKDIVSSRVRISGPHPCRSSLMLGHTRVAETRLTAAVLGSKTEKKMILCTPHCPISGEQSTPGKMYNDLEEEEDPKKIKAAVFYSISSSQKGLKGIELGNYLIKRVVRELQNEFPQISEFSSLSPIPLFRTWLLDKLKNIKRGNCDILFTKEEIENFQKHFHLSDFYKELRRLIITNGWVNDSAVIALLEVPLMRLCANYLYLQKRRGFALDSVANFHLKNGAIMWRLNWGANFLPRGLSSSCGIMVNYRYFLEETEIRSMEYLEKQKISASEQILKLAASANELMTSHTSKL